MAYTVKRVDVWSGEIEDRAGGLAAKLGPLADAGANLAFVIARRQPHIPGRGVVFLGPLSGAKQQKVAQAAGLSKANDLFALQVEGTNKPGSGYQITRKLADAGINIRGISAGATGTKFVLFVAFDSSADVAEAARLLRSGK
ncbi:MAG TPA: ACT domain-containing protein [Gemmataceae bacterium]|nr:ACT domain-containing protein [Gemmataceae bacterium]